MFEFVWKLFDTSDFPQRWNCGNWSLGHGWLHIISDALTWAAYTAIPLVLAFYILRRKEVFFPRVFWLFCAFIFACGTVHLIEAVIFWIPVYRVSGMAKLVTAIVSWATVIALVRIAPQALKLPYLGEAEERFRLTFEASPSGMLVANADGAIVMVNAATEEIFGYSRDELLNQPIETLLPEEFRVDHQSHRRDFMEAPHARKMGEGRDLSGKHKDGRLIPVEVGLAPLEFGGQKRVIASVVDISERKSGRDAIERANQALSRSNEELNQFGYVASHDLRAPLRGIDSLAKMIEEDEATRISSESLEKFRLLRVRVNRMHKLLDDLLAYSRAGKAVGHVQAVDMNVLVQDAADTVAIPDHISFVLHDDLPTLSIDPVPVSQIFRNLIDNAAKHHTGDSGVIEVGCVETDEFAEFCVRDDGPGIAPEFHDKIFQMFETLAPRDQVEGSGMGLALAKKLANSLGGDIRIESVPAEGSRFYVLLPLHRQHQNGQSDS